MTNRQKPLINLEVVQAHFHRACHTRNPIDLWHATADIPVLLAELHRTRSLLALARLAQANLLAAARATLTAARDGDPEALYYLIDELDAQGQLRRPADGEEDR